MGRIGKNVLVLLLLTLAVHAQSRKVHYYPKGTDFVCENGKMRFNRALYGTNTGFRVEAGDLPEFALYMPGMGGNFKFGLIAGDKSKWLIAAQSVKAIYRPGAMLYEIKDPLLGNGMMRLHVLALADAEGMIIKTSFENVPSDVELVWMYGGATGKKFSRDGDIGADPESVFYLQEANCKGNVYELSADRFSLTYGGSKKIRGVFPFGSKLKLVDASGQKSPLGVIDVLDAPALFGSVKTKEGYFLLENGGSGSSDGGDSSSDGHFLLKNNGSPSANVVSAFEKAEYARAQLSGRITLSTPDPYLNTLAGALNVAADAIWEDPTYLHGAVAWRMRLNAWRGAYVADPLGWHDRAKKHFSSYALSQVTTAPVTGVVADTALHLARQQEKIGNALFSDGYICRNPNGDFRAHHYDMNLVFIDQLLNHFNWTGDTAYVREMWPLLRRHLAWEKRNFDVDGDGLYDAYAAIWASDALQYSGGGVTHTSAYNYRANKTAAELAKIIGEDGSLYEKEAQHIHSAIQQKLWLPQQGWYAEYKDISGKQLVHPYPGLWTIYHVIDAKVPDPFQAFQSLRYIDTELPHIPVKADGWEEKGLYLLSSSNWQPYTWSVNNVALAENLHAALAYWQGNRSEEAFQLWRSAILESMYLSASPGGFQQLSFYDAIRGELYRDFADPIGMAARSLVEGLFGIQPDVLHDTLAIQPGFPARWEHASLVLPDVHFAFERHGLKDSYKISQHFKKELQLKLILPAYKDDIENVSVNGRRVTWQALKEAVGKPMLQINAPAAGEYNIVIQWKENSGLQIRRGKMYGAHFVQVSRGVFTWWEAVNLTTKARTLAVTPPSFSKDYEKIALPFNDKITNLFKQRYLSPRPAVPTLQLPVQGIGNWCYPLVTASLDDSGVRRQGALRSMEGIPFATPSDTLQHNIAYTSLWDNYPDSMSVGISGKANHAWLLMAGTTNPMQSRITNGLVVVSYTDGSRDTLALKNPENWWPIEQDYITDGLVFNTGAPMPERLYLKDGVFAKGLRAYTSIKGFSNRAIDGGAATLLSMPLQRDKELYSLSVHTIANDVVIGLMALTLSR